MQISDYIEKTEVTAIYPGQGEYQGLVYVVSGLCGETGELFEVAKKMLRDDEGILTEERKERFKKECGDICYYFGSIIREIYDDFKAFDIDVNEFQKEVIESTAVDGYEAEGFARIFNPLIISHKAADKCLDNLTLAYTADMKEQVKALHELAKRSLVVFEQVAILSDAVGLELEDILQTNLDKLLARKKANKIKGDGEELEDR